MTRIQITREFLFQQYTINKKSSYKIAAETQYSDRFIRYKIKEYNLSRTQQEAANINYYSPIHTISNLQLPTKKIESYSWYKYFYESYPDIHSFINKLSIYQDYKFNIPKNIKSQMEENIINFEELLSTLSYNYFIFGDSYILINNLQDDELGFKILPPEDVSVEILSKTQIHYSNTTKNEKIPENNILHLKRNSLSYQPYGTSIIKSYLPFLSHRDLLIQTKNTKINPELFQTLNDNNIVENEIKIFKKILNKTITKHPQLKNYNISLT